jgi:glycosyltransferase involved in cell wall biosynthesis
MPKVSIIVPIYNVEDYLTRSLDSLQRQTLTDIQIILVNDGSTDGSLELCYKLQKSDKRVVIVDKPNGGVSSARNAGLEVAEGEYVGFVDPDDWVEPHMYERLYSTITAVKADVCICNYVLENRRYSIPVMLPVQTDLLDSEKDIIEELICNMLAGPTLNTGTTPIMGSVWRLLIRRELIETNKLQFAEGISLMEDLIFCVQALLVSSTVSIDRGCYYHYVQREKSAVHAYREGAVDFKVYDILALVLKDKLQEYPQLQKRMDFRYVSIILSLVNNELHRDNSKDLPAKLDAISNLCRDERLRKILKGLDMRGYTLRRRLVLRSLRRGWSLFLLVYYGVLVRYYGVLVRILRGSVLSRFVWSRRKRELYSGPS